MDRKTILDGIAKATVALLVVEALARLAVAFGVQVEGLVYLDITFAIMLATTFVGYGSYYGRMYGFPRLLVLSIVSGFAGLTLMFVSVVGITLLSVAMRGVVFWLGALLLALSVPLGSLGVRRIERIWPNYMARFDVGRRRRYDATDRFGGCADGRKPLPPVSLGSPALDPAGGSAEGPGFKLEWGPGSIIIQHEDGNGIAMAGAGKLEVYDEGERVDGICIAVSTCRLVTRMGQARIAMDQDAQALDFKGLEDLDGRLRMEYAQLQEQAESFVKDVLDRYRPEAVEGERVAVNGLIDVREVGGKRLVRVPGVYVYEGPEGKVVKIGGKIVRTKVTSEMGTLEFNGVYREGEKPVVVIKNLSPSPSFVVVGPRWMARRRVEEGGDNQG